MKTIAYILFAAFFALPISFGQAIQLPQLPTYVAAGPAYNQASGFNLWVSAIVPVANSSGLYESTTTDLFPTKATVNGKTVYTFQTSIRQGLHKVLHSDAKNMVLIGGDGGIALTQQSAAASGGTGTTTGASAAVTFTYVRQLTKNFAFMLPIRGLYLPNLGWQPIVEAGFVWKP